MAQTITIVSGLPRSGTSMMMKMLEAGGMTIMSDGIRAADEDNPKGYYELEQVKQLDKTDDKSWLKDAEGKVVKIISQLLRELPADYNYKVIFMRRRMQEILASQKKMLERRGEPTDRISDDEISTLFEKHIFHTESWLQKQPNIDVLYVTYHEVIAEPAAHTDKIAAFVDGDVDKSAMAVVVDAALHRNRG